MRFIWVLTAIVMVSLTSVPSNSSRHPCKQPNFRLCRGEFSLSDGNLPSRYQTSILKDLCDAGHAHRVCKGHCREQFAVMNIHTHKGNRTVEWYGGETENVICNSAWCVDTNLTLHPGREGNGSGNYVWYLHGIPMWPVLGQYLKHHRGKLIRRVLGSNLAWPNYAIAMPMYLVNHECENYREPLISMRKRFNHNATDFSKLKRVKDFLEKIMKEFQDEKKNECPKPISIIENYEKWLQPFILRSLKPMMKSAKKSNNNRCPGELYLFLSSKLFPNETRLLSKDLEGVLHHARCLNKTCPVIGHLSGYRN